MCVCLHAQNESDVLKWVVRKEFGEMRRCLELEEAAFMQRVESTASALIGSIQSQADHMGTLLARFQEAEGTLDALSNESHLTFITVRKMKGERGVTCPTDLLVLIERTLLAKVTYCTVRFRLRLRFRFLYLYP